MSKKYNLQSLEKLKGLSKKIKNNPVKKEYWIEEEKFLTEMAEKRNKLYESIKMSYDKFVTPFTI